MWISYTDPEVNTFHPICETALNMALERLSKNADYRVVHHEKTSSLEMDFAIRNVKTGQYLCVIEVKRTPTDINSARYQYQAMSYVMSNARMSEKPYYILTNLEYAFAFRYDPTRTRVVQQMLKPGFLHIGNFSDYDLEENYVKMLSIVFSDLINNFLNDNFEYLTTLEEFDNHMRNIVYSTQMWKSSLVVILYEYIRGAFTSIGRQNDLPYDVRRFRNNIEKICTEAARVNFKEIFTFIPGSFESTLMVAN